MNGRGRDAPGSPRREVEVHNYDTSDDEALDPLEGGSEDELYDPEELTQWSEEDQDLLRNWENWEEASLPEKLAERPPRRPARGWPEPPREHNTGEEEDLHGFLFRDGAPKGVATSRTLPPGLWDPDKPRPAEASHSPDIVHIRTNEALTLDRSTVTFEHPKVLLADAKFCSERSGYAATESRNRKKYTPTAEAIKEGGCELVYETVRDGDEDAVAAPKVLTLAVSIMGHVYNGTLEGLAELGVPRGSVRRVAKQMSKVAVSALHSMLALSREIEHRKENRHLSACVQWRHDRKPSRRRDG